MQRPFRKAAILVALAVFLLSWPFILYEPAMPTERVWADQVETVPDDETVATLSDVQSAKRPFIREAIETGDHLQFEFRTPPDVSYVAYQGTVYRITTLVSGPEGWGHIFALLSMGVAIPALFGAAYVVGAGLRRRAE